METDDIRRSREPARPFQFTLASLLAVTTACGIGLGFLRAFEFEAIAVFGTFAAALGVTIAGTVRIARGFEGVRWAVIRLVCLLVGALVVVSAASHIASEVIRALRAP